MVQNKPTSPGAQGTEWTTGVATPSAVVSPSPFTHDVAPGGQPIYAGGDPDPGGRDDVAASVAEAVSSAMARQAEHQADILPLGTTYGDAMTLPLTVSQLSQHTAGIDAGHQPQGSDLTAFLPPPG